MRYSEIIVNTVPNPDPLNEGRLSDAFKGALLASALAVAGFSMMKEPVEKEKSSSVTVAVPTQQDVDMEILALTIWGEARSHGVDGMRAVGHVIKNRADSGRRMFGEGIRGVALKKKQFSCWNEGDPNREMMQNINDLPTGPDRSRWIQAQKIAEAIVTGRDRDPTKGALFYHTEEVEPYWAKKLKPITRVASHLFYRDVPKA